MNPQETGIWEQIDKTGMPRHIAIVMDGNGRWAKQKGMPRIFGHRAGVKTVDRIVSLACEINLECLTLYSFSTQNWGRPRQEVEALIEILQEYLLKETERMVKNNIRFNTIGRISDLPPSAVGFIDKVKKATSKNSGTILTLALSYGSQDEILDAVRSIARKTMEGAMKPEDINRETFSRELYTAGLPEVDLLIRTSGELRVSNFLLWQIAYAELFFTDVLWPAFSNLDLLNAIKNFQERERRFGLSGEQVVKSGLI